MYTNNKAYANVMVTSLQMYDNCFLMKMANGQLLWWTEQYSSIDIDVKWSFAFDTRHQ